VPDAATTPLAVDPAAILGLALAVATAVRRRAPLGLLALALVTALAAPVGPLDGPVVLTVVYAVVAYSAGASTNGRAAILAAVGIAALIVASATRPGSTPQELSDLADGGAGSAGAGVGSPGGGAGSAAAGAGARFRPGSPAGRGLV